MKKLLIISNILILSISSFAQVFDVDTISMTGSIEDRINLVFLGDGYQENELDKFIDDVHWMEDALLSKSPYKEYRAYFNSFAIKVPSNVSGAANDPDSLIDNYFGSTFNSSGIWRLVTARRSGKVQSVLMDNFPQYDQAVIVVNDDRYGGSGGWAATSTTHSNGPEICIHEIGHSFAGLSDEYWAGPQYARENINMTQEADRSKVRWKNWMDFSGVGIYSHEEETSWKRPHQNCEMRFLNREFCPVCQEAITDKILDITSPIVDYSPADDGFTHTEPEIEFSVNLIGPTPNTLNIRWTLNTDSIAGNIDTLRFSSSKLIPGENKVVAFILDTTKYIRSSSHSRSHLHKVIWDFYSATTGINEYKVNRERFDIEIFPNPATEYFTLSGYLDSNSVVDLSLIDQSGRIIDKIMKNKYMLPGHFTEEVNLGSLGLAAGNYYVLIDIDDHSLSLPLIIN